MQESMVNQPSASGTAPRRTMLAVGGVLVVPVRPSGPPPPDVPFSIGTAALSLIFSCPTPFSFNNCLSLSLELSSLSRYFCLSLSPLSLSLLVLIWPFVCKCFLKPPMPFPPLSFDAHAVLLASSCRCTGGRHSIAPRYSKFLEADRDRRANLPDRGSLPSTWYKDVSDRTTEPLHAARRLVLYTTIQVYFSGRLLLTRTRGQAFSFSVFKEHYVRTTSVSRVISCTRRRFDLFERPGPSLYAPRKNALGNFYSVPSFSRSLLFLLCINILVSKHVAHERPSLFQRRPEF